MKRGMRATMIVLMINGVKKLGGIKLTGVEIEFGQSGAKRKVTLGRKLA